MPDGVELDGELAGEDHEEEESVEGEEGPEVPPLTEKHTQTLHTHTLGRSVEFFWIGENR